MQFLKLTSLRLQASREVTTIRNLDAQISIMKVLNVGTTEGSCDQQALESDRIQLQDTITSLRIQLDGLKVENGATVQTSSGPSTSETPKVLAPGMYNLGSKYIPPPKRANWVKPTPLPKKRQDLNNVCGACNKSLVFANHTDCLVMCDGSVNVKPHQTKRFKRQPKKEWKPIKRVWKPISKPVANSKSFRESHCRHFSSLSRILLTRNHGNLLIMPIELPRVPKGSLVVQIVLWYLDSGCSRHMTGDRARLINFVEKFIGTVRFGNDEYAAIVGYGDYKLGDTIISRVYYVEGLKHNLFSVGQFCDGGLEVAFRQHSCHIRNYDMVDLLKGSRTTNLYSISLNDMMSASPVCLLTKASSTKSWLWHRRLNHLNFGTLNELARKNLVRGLPMLKYDKDHLCPSCQLGKSKKAQSTKRLYEPLMQYVRLSEQDNGTEFMMKTLDGLVSEGSSRFLWADAVPLRVILLIGISCTTASRKGLL
ncbi:retrovirus-related pol polyprotein from transposon TNT 1-94 [Tanacetum coccineum]